MSILGGDRKAKYESKVVLGETYRDTRTGITGRAAVVSFYEDACERVILEWVKDGDIKDAGFDAVRLEPVKAGPAPEPPRPTTGGPDRPVARR